MSSSFSPTSNRILLGITGGVAAYKAAELVRLLIQDGMSVQAVMTHSACQFIGPATLQALTGELVFTDMWQTNDASSMAHINLSREVDVILIAPASADFIAKLTNGLADDLLSTLCLARDCPLMIAPAMNLQMWENPATQRNLMMLQQDGVKILGPASGEQACGEIGVGRMLEADELAQAVRAMYQPKLLQNQRVLITAGPTFEAIDAVRGMTNTSSGKMGYALAHAALDVGAEVTLISGPVCLKSPVAVKCISVISARDMMAAVKQEAPLADIFISVAAVADYRVVNTSKQKIKKTEDNLMLELTPNPDILKYVANMRKGPFCVGFAAETENLEKNAESKRRNKKLPLLIANKAQDTIGLDESALILLYDEGKKHLAKAPKIDQARHIINHIALLYKK